MRYICYDLINQLIKTMNDLGLTGLSKEIESLIEFRSPEQLADEIKRLSAAVCAAVGRRKESRNTALRDGVVRFIETHYREAELSLAGIAQRFGHSSSYLSRFFKEQMGQTITGYILELRMAAARRQLAETNRPIKAIVVDVGYRDIASFMRRFKSLEGLTPGTYRRLHSVPAPQA
jgi:AraC-like DNA-binding protein